MKFFDYLEALPIDFAAKSKILSMAMGHDGQYTYGGYRNVAKKQEVPEGFSIPDNLVDLMFTVNRMVKHESCPNNCRNRFYYYKAKVIRRLARMGRVTDVYDEDPCLSMVVDGKYQFHQLKLAHPRTNFEILGKREYKATADPLEFDERAFYDFQMAAVYFLGKYRRDTFGLITDPKRYKQ